MKMLCKYRRKRQEMRREKKEREGHEKRAGKEGKDK